uniref:Cytochrome P450 n=1 Tax=Ditylenchus dipsaci TaxID=166011 RepID=A0A915ELC2_9BILA
MEQSDLNSDNQEDKFFNLPALKGLCMDLFFAGQETTSYTLQFIFLYMIVFPEVRTKMQEELDKEIGDNEEGTKRVTLADRAKLPYTNAVICESQRLCNLVPMNIHTELQKMWKSIFPEPHKFMPERFLENEQLKRIEEFIPFGIGKRQCMGESLARAELFLFTTNLFYLFKVSA